MLVSFCFSRLFDCSFVLSFLSRGGRRLGAARGGCVGMRCQDSSTTRCPPVCGRHRGTELRARRKGTSEAAAASVAWRTASKWRDAGFYNVTVRRYIPDPMNGLLLGMSIDMQCISVDMQCISVHMLCISVDIECISIHMQCIPVDTGAQLQEYDARGSG